MTALVPGICGVVVIAGVRVAAVGTGVLVSVGTGVTDEQDVVVSPIRKGINVFPL